MSGPRITVCIPTYNRAHFLGQALHSLCDQGLSYEELVVAVSDNASTDQTPDVVTEYQDRLQIQYHRNSENLGHFENIKIVTALCNTPYLVLLPDDDHHWLRRPLRSSFGGGEPARLTAVDAVVFLGKLYPSEPRKAP